jgi:hypothetical protein
MLIGMSLFTLLLYNDISPSSQGLTVVISLVLAVLAVGAGLLIWALFLLFEKDGQGKAKGLLLLVATVAGVGLGLHAVGNLLG